MSSKKNIIISASIALAAAILIIAASMLAGIAPHQIQTLTTAPTTLTSSTAQSTSTQTTGTSSTPAPTTSSTTQPSTTQTTSTTTVAPTKGILTIMLTDPPKLPPGVTAVYIKYSNFAVHVAGMGNESGWVPVNVSGEIELTGLVNVSQTIASVPIEKGRYNQIRFNVTKALVEYNSRNYTAVVRTGQLTVKIEEGGIIVNASKPAFTLIDIQPTVFNFGNATNPLFVITAAAKAVPVSPEEVEEEGEHILQAGHRMELKGKTWWENIRKKIESSKIEITSASVSKNTLKVEVKNVGNETVYLKLLTLFPVSYIPKEILGHEALKVFVPNFLGAQVFIINENGTLTPVKIREVHELKGEEQEEQAREEMGALFGGRGYALKPGATVILSYNGTITFGPEFGQEKGKTFTPITTGEYLITVIGENAIASKIV